ncbi:phosphodiester glycosidase family protein [Tessaracoccus sp. G1721]
MTSTAPRILNRRVFLGGTAALGLAAVGGTSWALDRFLIEHAEVTAASDYTGLPGTQASATPTAGATATAGRSIDITAHTSGSGSDAQAWFVADVALDDATALRSAFAEDTFGTNIIDLPSSIAADVGALFAVNGDYYGFRDTGIVIRDGVAFRDIPARQGLALYRDGTMRSYDETATGAAQLISDGVWQTLSFGPTLVDGGALVSGIDRIEIDTNVGNHSIQGSHPRTGLGMIGANHFVFAVVDGRSSGYSRGMTLPEFAQLFADLGCQVAYNLDGGGSSVMIYDDELVNNPLGKGEERGTSDILWIGR